MRFTPTSCPGPADPGNRSAIPVSQIRRRTERADLDGQRGDRNRAGARADQADIARFVGCRTVTVCDETSARAGTPGAPRPRSSVKQKRHGEHDSVAVTIAEGFRSASYDLSMFIRSDVRHS